MIVHFAIDVRYGLSCATEGFPVSKVEVAEDPLLRSDLETSLPLEDQDILNEFLLFRAFTLHTTDPEEVMQWVEDRFDHVPDYIWIDGRRTKPSGEVAILWPPFTPVLVVGFESEQVAGFRP